MRGLAFGLFIVGIVLVVAGIICWRRRKAPEAQEDGGAGGGTPRPPGPSPRSPQEEPAERQLVSTGGTR